ncbi:aldo/keto reductase [Nocardiopsis suaedae]|uniref:Aldo/keto reductase n=1 Tax=Nocardiopsis suaedae TaxID=3018444 RepID=A0ABT4TGN6_9ACTN|nr:aldo/keto reductase [Nocardiopsis suaedae]MDA2803882.1 aldo/keto reductase [Nocardiopsis suaedae]
MTTLGNSGLEIHPVVLGGNTFGWTSDEKESHRVLDAFLDAGGTLVDTADSYSAWVEGNEGGESEHVIGSWLAGRGRRDDVLIATKVSQHPEFRGLAASNVKAAAEASLKRLGTDCIDIYYAHFDDAGTPLEDTVGAFDALVKEGKVRYVGVSNYGPDRLRRWLEIAEGIGAALPVALQPHYSLVHRKTVEPELRDIALGAGMGMLPYWALAAGFLTGKYRTEADLEGRARAGSVGRYMGPEGLAVVDRLVEIADAHGVAPATVALAWVLGRPGMAGVLASARTTEQLPALMDAARVSLSEDEAAALTRASDAVGA